MLVIKNKEICKIFNCSPATASRKIKLFRDHKDLPNYSAIPRSEFLEFYGLDKES